ncbi:MAG: bifunctional adenosylcobinamide kinase/adenosylcobinamide-phosphate guanylyltransferase [Thermomicrobiales bacterium]
MTTITLVLGGVRSGKSAWAEQRAAASGRQVLYVATATAGDDEMTARIAAHRAARPAHWRTIEAAHDLAAAITAEARAGEIALVDCLTLWVSNLIMREFGEGADVALADAAALRLFEARVIAAANGLLAAAHLAEVDLVVVSNEVGMGLVPPFPLGRVYRDLLGRVNQVVASRADPVVLMLAGLPLDLRRMGPETLRP